MCKSASDGGQRCAAHTRPAFQRALTRAHQPGHEAAFDNAAIEHASTKQGRTEVEALLTFATDTRTRLRIENLLSQGDRLRAQRQVVTAEVTQQLQAHQGGRTGTAPAPDTSDAPSLRLVHSTNQITCETCRGTGLDYDEYWGCEDCGGEGVVPATSAR